MPWYNDLRPQSDDKKQTFGLTFPDLNNEERAEIIKNILRLRRDLSAEIPDKSSDTNILIATWNIREFGHYSKRTAEAYFYIAEIINRFDLIAIQEIKSSLKDLQIIMRLLGSEWKYLVNDITDGTGGNNESFAYIYNSKRVSLTGLAGEIVLWEEITQNLHISQLMRTPYITGFKAGWKEFAIINVHLKPSNNANGQQIRKDEVIALTNIIEKRLKNKTMWTENLMIMGDFNIYHNNSDILSVIDGKGFSQIQSVVDVPTTESGSEAFDKIFYLKNDYFDLSNAPNRAGGVFDIYRSVYRLDDDWEDYKALMREHKEDPTTLTTPDKYKSYFKTHWRTRQLSDHLPLWISMQIDHSDEFLREKLDANLNEV